VSTLPKPFRVCRFCKTLKPSSEFAYKSQMCATCRISIDPVALARERYRNTHREALAERARAKSAANPGLAAEKQRCWRIQNPDGARAAVKRYRASNPGINQLLNANRSAKRSGSEGTWTLAEWEAIKKSQDYRCLGCGKREPEIRLTVDHIVPFKLRGPNVASNIQGLCLSCNCTKKTKVLDLRTTGNRL
jgi:5-methylcytosine-specific restriction endonuclease McrA